MASSIELSHTEGVGLFISFRIGKHLDCVVESVVQSYRVLGVQQFLYFYFIQLSLYLAYEIASVVSNCSWFFSTCKLKGLGLL